MKLAERRAEIEAKTLAACRELIAAEIRPTGRKLRELCPGHPIASLVRARDGLIKTGTVSMAQFWGGWTDRLRVTIGPAAVEWPDWTDEHTFEIGRRPKRRDARRRESEVST